MDYYVKSFSELSTKEFYEIAKLRIAVFVVEQTCPYQEIDAYDEQAVHIWMQEGQTIIGYTRIIDQDATVTFGRVIIHPSHRGKKLGNQLLEKTLAVIKTQMPDKPIVISAQAHLIDFYGAYGFVPVSDVYLEDDIPHIRMRKEKQ
ncbi:GNAT family N-acetyltransferase [Snodgrassella alvi]|uniref:GNAT family N-acetyltransferase n=1 Tax=Snodgrassella alvi TaxID=1196083 RepID=A0A2N9WU41_9NEIS|nr:GNAT family N-acetyltransferase [Snodgrassella alvi]PIT12784.1 GNAT family N-acetyltransferase [Snodgrassella alvi]PIT15502.1 GNAT family N-acetyltransferase [Snodgrassella alvi]PIT15522.1 GNAT family N-acetyltransferase [Snodgrassella alvi]